jgi:hypothetical protein
MAQHEVDPSLFPGLVPASDGYLFITSASLSNEVNCCPVSASLCFHVLRRTPLSKMLVWNFQFLVGRSPDLKVPLVLKLFYLFALLLFDVGQNWSSHVEAFGTTVPNKHSYRSKSP